jgi:hypothetical protein
MAAQCIYCHHKAARSRKRTDDYKCDHCDRTFSIADFEEYNEKRIENEADEWRVNVQVRHRLRVLAAAVGTLGPPTEHGYKPTLISVLVAVGAAYGTNLALAETQPWPVAWAIGVGVVLFFVLRAILNVAIGDRHRWLRMHESAAFIETIGQNPKEVATEETYDAVLAALCSALASGDMVKALQAWGEGLHVPRGAVAAAVFGDGGPDSLLSPDLKTPLTGRLTVPSLGHDLSPLSGDEAQRYQTAFEDANDRLCEAVAGRTSLDGVVALARAGYEIEPELVPPPKTGQDGHGIEKAFEDLLPEEQVRAMRAQRIEVIGSSAGALSFVAGLSKVKSGKPVGPVVVQLLVDALLRQRSKEAPAKNEPPA